MPEIERRNKIKGGKWSNWFTLLLDGEYGDPIPDGVRLMLTDMEEGWMPVKKVTIHFDGGSSYPWPEAVQKVQYRVKEER